MSRYFVALLVIIAVVSYRPAAATSTVAATTAAAGTTAAGTTAAATTAASTASGTGMTTAGTTQGNSAGALVASLPVCLLAFVLFLASLAA